MPLRINWFCDHEDHGKRAKSRKIGRSAACKLELSRFESVEFSRPSETYGEMINYMRGLGWSLRLGADHKVVKCFCPEHAGSAPTRGRGAFEPAAA